ncbi:MAG: acyl-ACP--UDP-N-acetylglucosamine O-acyltransferase [Candidatus Aminicenantes bacterium]|nr:acyl-ACP--UDP-N-acetylglucosamine O-acyltransferase [Candidatus Aminicenantes bacterium]
MKADEVYIHPSADVHPGARLGAGVWIGPFCRVGENVSLGPRTRLEAHVFLTGLTEVGPDCRFSPYSVIGTEPQDVSYRGEETRVVIGGNNVFREFLTVHRGTPKGGGVTRIGDRNYFMAYCHVAHDCRVGDETIFTNAATLAGHVTVEDFVVISAFSSVHQFCRLGRYAFVGGYSVVTQDVVPFSRVVGARPLRLFGMNIVGLRRRGFTRERLQVIKDMFRLLFSSDLNTSQALERIEAEIPVCSEREELTAFVRASKRGIAQKAGETWDRESD